MVVLPVETKSLLKSSSWYILKSKSDNEESDISNTKLLSLTTFMGGLINDNWCSEPPIDTILTILGGICFAS